MHTLNVRLAAICLVVVVVLGGGVHLLHGFQVHRQADALKVASKGAEDAFTKLQTACDTLAGPTSELKKLEEQEKPRGTVEKERDDAIQVLESYVGPEANRKELLRLGRVAEDKNLDEATRLLDSYLRLIPKDQKEQLHIGLLYAEKPDSHATFVIYPRIVRAKNPRAAFFKLEEILRTTEGALSEEELRTARRTLVDMAIQVLRFPDAETHLKQLMQETPDDPELLVLDGWILGIRKQDEEACKQLRRAIDLKPTETETYVLLAKFLLGRLNRKAEADEVMHGMIYCKLKDKDGKVVKDKDGKEVEVEVEANANSKQLAHRKYANYLCDQGKYDEALVQAKRVLELAPEDTVGLWLAARCYLAQGVDGRSDEAKALYKKAEEAEAKHKPAEEVKALFDQAKKANPKTEEEVKALYKTAEGYLNRGIKADKSSADMYPVMFEVKNRLGQRDESVAVLRTGLENTKGTYGYAAILWELVRANIVDGRLDEAAKGIKELKEPYGLNDPPPRVKFLEAQLAVAKGDWTAAKATLAEVIPKLQGDPQIQRLAQLILAQCYQRQQEDVEKQIVAYSAALNVDPNFTPARMGLADIFVSRGNLPEAYEQYRLAASAPRPDPAAAISLARVAIMMRIREDKEKRNWEPVDKLLDEIERQSKPTPELAVLRAEVLLAKDRDQDAKELLEECVKKFPKSPQAWLGLFNMAIYLAEHETVPAKKELKWEQVSAYLDQAQAEQNLGDHPIVREKRGSTAVLRKDPHAGELLKKLGENLGTMSDFEKTYLWRNLATLSVQADDLDLARAYYRRVAEQEPRDVLVRYHLCDLNLRIYEKGRAPDLQELDQRLSEIERLSGRGPFWLYGKAVRSLVQAKKPDPQLLMEARGYLQEALAVRKDWSAPTVLAGKICELQKEPDQALEYYTHAVYRMGERDGDVIRRTVHLLLPRGRIDEAGQMLVFLEKQKSSLLGELSQEYTFYKVFRGDPLVAEKEVDKSVADDCKNYRDFLRQGQMYGLLAHRWKLKAQKANLRWQRNSEMIRLGQRAINALLKAEDLNPQADEVWIAIVQLLVDVGQPDKAKPLIDKAEKSLKGEQAPITMATFSEILSQGTAVQADEFAREGRAQDSVVLNKLAASYMEKAQAEYEAAAKASPQSSHVLRQVAAFYLRRAKLDLAEPLLQKIIALETPETLTDVCWARHSLADVLMSRGDFDFDHLCQAMALIEKNLHSKAASTDDKRAKVRLLIADPRKEKIGEAIQAMEDLVKNTDAKPDDYFNLAKLYLKKGDWTSYENEMRSVLGAQRGAVQQGQLVFYINTLLEKNQLDDADKWLLTLEKTAPNHFDTIRLRAEYQFLRGNYGAARDVAMAFLDNPNAQPPNRGQQVLLVAQVMEKFSDRLKAAGKQVVAAGFGEKADTLFASLRRIFAKGDVFFAAYLARQKRIHECLDVLEKCPAEDLQTPAIVIIQSKAADSAQCRQLEKILLSAAKGPDRPVALLSVLAELHAQQAQYDKSIADYRELLAKQPGNYRTLNNLGLSLARAGQNLDEAIKLVDEALKIRGPMAEVLDSRAVVHIARQEPEKALEDMAAAIKDDGAAEQYFHQAWAYLLAGKKTEAATAFATALKKGLNPKDLDSREVSAYERLRDAL